MKRMLDKQVRFDVNRHSYQKAKEMLQALQSEWDAAHPQVQHTPWECNHPDKQLRIRTCRNGSEQYAYQCKICGRQVGVNQAKPMASVRRTLNKWDEETAKRFAEQVAIKREEMGDLYSLRRDEENGLFWRYYHAYVGKMSPRWLSIRDRVLARCSNLCEGCRKVAPSQVHHLTYDHLGEELLFELVALCDACHRKCHKHMQ